MMIDLLKKAIARPATTFNIGGFKPSHTLNESWIAKVSAYQQEEALPVDDQGVDMIPLLQLYLPNMPFVPKTLVDIKLLTVFMSQQYPNPLEPMGAKWLIREYDSLDTIVQKELNNPISNLKAFPLQPRLVSIDYPIWDGGGLTPEQEDCICKMEDNEEIEDYYEAFSEHCYDTKLGGYPSYCQSGIGIDEGYGEGYEFVFQISSSEKINLNVVDNGSFMFARNPKTKEWQLYYDFC